jgi:hypothetical protein
MSQPTRAMSGKRSLFNPPRSASGVRFVESLIFVPGLVVGPAKARIAFFLSLSFQERSGQLSIAQESDWKKERATTAAFAFALRMVVPSWPVSLS